ncbi:hypothetical protein C9374_007606 [Naegleria lovaniensis]|uniref:40S ribosomal protein S6 n=1 Tax=Naegleria lovaniensis TaxID=51637 RepID=A0AA88GMG7_NAELO|nr:uncharacterized protein C9374_007606 [Naegleria lovaniensis]KAG2378968.1 hypothetical protein C9374_007606 [Naegleria lovaniensis]
MLFKVAGRYRTRAPTSKHNAKKIDEWCGSGYEYMGQDPDLYRCLSEDLDKGSLILLHHYQVSCPFTGRTQLLRMSHVGNQNYLFGRKIGDLIDGSLISPMYKNYIFKISGACDRNGRPYHPGIYKIGRVRVLKEPGTFGYQAWRAPRSGCRRRKIVKGCVLDAGAAAVSLIVVKKGDQEIPGLTDQVRPKTLGPKRASKIRKLFNLSKLDDVRKYVIKRNVKIGQSVTPKGVKIQRLVTPERIRRKQQRIRESMKKAIKRQRDREMYEKRFPSTSSSTHK